MVAMIDDAADDDDDDADDEYDYDYGSDYDYGRAEGRWWYLVTVCEQKEAHCLVKPFNNFRYE